MPLGSYILGRGADTPFTFTREFSGLGGGSTLAAAAALGVEGIGIEIEPKYAALARKAVPRLAKLAVDLPGVLSHGPGQQMRFSVDGSHVAEPTPVYIVGGNGNGNGNGKCVVTPANGTSRRHRG